MTTLGEWGPADDRALDAYLTRGDRDDDPPEDDGPTDPWAVLRAVRAHPLVAATTADAPINGGDAEEALCELRALVDAALRDAPPPGR